MKEYTVKINDDATLNEDNFVQLLPLVLKQYTASEIVTLIQTMGQGNKVPLHSYMNFLNETKIKALIENNLAFVSRTPLDKIPFTKDEMLEMDYTIQTLPFDMLDGDDIFAFKDIHPEMFLDLWLELLADENAKPELKEKIKINKTLLKNIPVENFITFNPMIMEKRLKPELFDYVVERCLESDIDDVILYGVKLSRYDEKALKYVRELNSTHLNVLSNFLVQLDKQVEDEESVLVKNVKNMISNMKYIFQYQEFDDDDYIPFMFLKEGDIDLFIKCLEETEDEKIIYYLIGFMMENNTDEIIEALGTNEELLDKVIINYKKMFEHTLEINNKLAMQCLPFMN